ncbi:fimbrial protein [Bordetella bronchiseptica]|uniref:fimbrial protein n=1 Tax=Bordetella bronchiseptica TaxID=518 RepID=UPI000F65ED3E|nr:fimbrial protein [Bordetella bronchiseptica]RSB99301.1 fimbrial protein [Bordetella bronchiseptica]RSC08361.1 fimbrial protein [Bordetella bronchiseptica]
MAGALAWHIPAHANDGTIVITGTITDTTCIVEDPAGPSPTKVVTLPKIAKTALKNVGDQAGRTPFIIKLKDCPSSLGNGVKAYFEPGPTTDYTTGDLRAYKMVYATNPQTQLSNITGATEAQGVQVRISNLNDSKIAMGANEATQQAAGFNPEAQTGDASKRTVTMRYLASYVKKNGNVEASAITTYVGFSVVYP